MQPLIAAARAFFLLMLLGVGAAARTLPLIPGILPNLQLAKVGSVTAIIAESNGRVVVAGDFTSIDGIPRRHIARLHADASLDANWGVPLPGPVRALATNESSIFVICQVAHAPYGSSQWRVFKLNRADGALDPLWQADVGSDSVSGLAVSGSDVFISGAFSSVNGRPKSKMAKLSAHGAGVVDLGWNVSLTGWSASFLSVSGTNLYLAGSFESVNGLKRAGFARVRTTGVGAVDPAWVPPEVGRWPYSIQIEGEHVYSPDSLLRQVIRIPVAGDGSPDPQWGTGPLPSDAWLPAFHVSGTNIYFGVNHLGDAQVTRRSLAAPSLVVPGEWQVTVQPGYSVELIHAAGTNVFVAGAFDRVGEQPAFGLARLGAELPFPNAVTSFTPRIEWPGAVFALALEANGGLIVGGDFGVASGVRRRNLARIGPDGSLDLSWNPEPDFPVKHLLIHSNSLFAATDFVFVDPSMPRQFVKVDLATGAIDDTWELDWELEPPVGDDLRFIRITDLAAAGTNLFVGQGMHGNNVRWGRVAKVSTEDGAADPDWKLETWVESLLVVGTNLFVGGDFSRIGSVDQNHLARVSLCGTGSVDTSFSPNPSGMVIELASDEVGLFVAGYFGSIGGLSRTSMAKLDLQTGQAFSEWSSGTNFGDKMTVAGTNLYVAGVDWNDGNPVMHVVRLSTLTGAIDPTWQIAPNVPPDGLRNNRLRTRSVHAIAVRLETIYIGGDFDLMSGLTRHGLAAFHPAPPGLPWLRYPTFEANRFECEVVAEPGRSFRIESSPDFATWSTLTNLLPATPSVRISLPAHEDVRFYRSR